MPSLRSFVLSLFFVLPLAFSGTTAVRAETPESSLATPHAVITPHHAEFDKVVEGAVVFLDFTVANTGTGPLEIQTVKTG
ncbi:hypothetical protein LJC47_02055 [Desulfosarcina sp. OttesenSCG-928-B08]|nr:hypothetical protein [Desulfosarcina sp. OttesenSCG-928-B08]